MKRAFQKGICIVLVLAMLLLCPVSASALVIPPTLVTSEGAKPVVVINGWQNNILYANPDSKRAEQVFPPSTNDMITIAETITNYVMMGEGYFDEVSNYIGTVVTSYFKDIPCNLDGTPQTNVGVKSMNHSLAYYQKNTALIDEMAGDLGKICATEAGYNRVYVFSYDWRLSPIDLASKLNTFIEDVVLSETGESKVNIIAEGMGANVASAYMKIYQENRSFQTVDNYVLVNSAAQGLSTIGALFGGHIDLDPNGFVRWMNDLSDNVPTAFAIWLTNYILNKEWEIYHMAATIDTYLVHELPYLYDRYIRATICYNAGLWALIPWTEDDAAFDQAKEFMYTDGKGNVLHMNKTLEEKIDKYHDIQRTAGATLQDAQKNGVHVAVVSGYNMQALPLYDGLDTNKGASENSDGIVDTKYSSFGATCAYLNNDYVGHHIVEQAIDDGHKHTNEESSDTHKITVDASTCAMPECTWFIKGLKNDYLHCDEYDAYYFISWLVFADKQRTVRDDGYYPQFMKYDRYGDHLYAMSVQDSYRFNIVGDIDLDGKVTSADARLILRAAARLTTLSGARLENADLDGDGKITATDARWCLRYVAKLVDDDDLPVNQKK